MGLLHHHLGTSSIKPWDAGKGETQLLYPRARIWWATENKITRVVITNGLWGQTPQAPCSCCCLKLYILGLTPLCLSSCHKMGIIRVATSLGCVKTKETQSKPVTWWCPGLWQRLTNISCCCDHVLCQQLPRMPRAPGEDSSQPLGSSSGEGFWGWGLSWILKNTLSQPPEKANSWGNACIPMAQLSWCLQPKIAQFWSNYLSIKK